MVDTTTALDRLPTTMAIRTFHGRLQRGSERESEFVIDDARMTYQRDRRAPSELESFVFDDLSGTLEVWASPCMVLRVHACYEVAPPYPA
jgi:hypothetical protein